MLRLPVPGVWGSHAEPRGNGGTGERLVQRGVSIALCLGAGFGGGEAGGDGLHLCVQSYTAKSGPSSTWETAPRRPGQRRWHRRAVRRSRGALSFCQGEQAEFVLPTQNPFHCCVCNQGRKLTVQTELRVPQHSSTKATEATFKLSGNKSTPCLCTGLPLLQTH